MKHESLVDELLARKKPLVDEFLKRNHIPRPDRKGDYRSVLRTRPESDREFGSKLENYLDEIQKGGKRRFYFLGGLEPVNIKSEKGLNKRRRYAPAILSEDEVGSDDNPAITNVEWVEGDPGHALFEYTQKKESKTREEGLDREELLDGETIRYEAYVLNRIRRHSYIEWYPIDGFAVVSVAQQIRQTDYQRIRGAMLEQFYEQISIAEGSSIELNDLIVQVRSQEDIVDSHVRFANGQATVDMACADETVSVNEVPMLNGIMNITSKEAMMRVRACWSPDKHRQLTSPVVVHIDAYEHSANIRQDAHPDDVAYVLSRIREIL